MTTVKHREPVLGVHDLVPPEGRVTVELLDERSLKVVKRVKAENAITNFWNENMANVIRNPVNNTQGYGFDGGFVTNTTDIASTFGTGWYTNLVAGKRVWNHPVSVSDYMRSIILTDSTKTVNQDEGIFPGTCNAFCYLQEAYAPGTNTKRTTLDLINSIRTRTTLHYEAEWSTGYGNGTHNSVGIGHVTWASNVVTLGGQTPSIYPIWVNGLTNWSSASQPNPAFAAGDHWRTGSTSGLRTFFGTNNGVASSDVPHMSGHRVSGTEWWTLVSGVAGNNLTKIDPSTATVSPFTAASASAGITITGPTMTTIGAATNRCGVTVIGSDLWLAYGTTLKRCAKPTNTTLSVTNTYAPVGVGTLVDLTTDGTSLYWLDSTTVWVINATTGAVSSSWSHGLTGTMFNLAFDPTLGTLLLSYLATGLSSTALWNTTNSTGTHTPVMVGIFSVAGVADGQFPIQPVLNPLNANVYVSSGLIFPLDQYGNHWVGAGKGTGLNITTLADLDIMGPTHLSRTVLGSPIVKTSANGMKVIYEFGF